ncbi:DNA internalization-related competence protein ComEC/Rec2 [Chitinibacteraceae bacterium HSL-7]
MRSLLAFALAACSAWWWPALPPAGILAASAITLMLLSLWQRRVWPATAFVAGILLVALTAQAQMGRWWPASRDGETLVATGRICSLVSQDEFSIRFEFCATDSGLRIDTRWYRAPQIAVRPGERWQLTLRMRAPHGQVNPAGFDRVRWMLQRGLAASATVRSGVRESGPEPWSVLALRSALSQRIHAASANTSGAALVAALTVGDQSRLSREQWQYFSRTGTTHLMSISGLHITLIAGWLAGATLIIWRRIPRLSHQLHARRAALLAGLGGAAIYSILAGSAIPTQRAVLMVGVAAFALWSGRPQQGWRIWLYALLAVLILTPTAPLSAGFWLSFALVGALLLAHHGRLRPLPAWQAALHGQGVATVASLPLLLVFFASLPSYSAVANAFAIPWFTLVVIPLSIAGCLDPSGVILNLASQCASIGTTVIAWIATWPVATQTWIAPLPWLLLATCVGVLPLLLPFNWKARVAGITLALMCWPENERYDLKMTILDVDQGLAILVQADGHALLFDTGTAAMAKQQTAPMLALANHQPGALLLSHDDADHAGGRDIVADAHPFAARLGFDGQPCARGQHWRWGKAAFEVIWPPAGIRNDHNGGSCVLQITVNGIRLLLPADITTREELALLKGGLAAQTLVVAAHHGSRTSSHPAFVAATRPRWVVFSSGWHSRFGHPHPRVVTRWQNAGTKTISTATAGAVTVLIEGTTVRLRRERTFAPRLWLTPDHGSPDTLRSHPDSG